MLLNLSLVILAVPYDGGFTCDAGLTLQTINGGQSCCDPRPIEMGSVQNLICEPARPTEECEAGETITVSFRTTQTVNCTGAHQTCSGDDPNKPSFTRSTTQTKVYGCNPSHGNFLTLLSDTGPIQQGFGQKCITETLNCSRPQGCGFEYYSVSRQRVINCETQPEHPQCGAAARTGQRGELTKREQVVVQIPDAPLAFIEREAVDHLLASVEKLALDKDLAREIFQKNLQELLIENGSLNRLSSGHLPERVCAEHQVIVYSADSCEQPSCGGCLYSGGMACE